MEATDGTVQEVVADARSNTTPDSAREARKGVVGLWCP